MREIRESAVAGTWYPGDPDVLSRDVKGYIEKAKKEKIEGEIVALVAPHAGYVYSGQVAAYGYKLIEGKSFDAVVVVAPSHYVGFKGFSLWDRGGYRTPLGLVPVDTELSKKIMEKSGDIRFIPEAHAKEHSLEMQIPFLQVALKSFKLVPIVMEPEWSWESCQTLGRSIADSARGKKVLLVASTDLSHFHYASSSRVQIPPPPLSREAEVPHLQGVSASQRFASPGPAAVVNREHTGLSRVHAADQQSHEQSHGIGRLVSGLPSGHADWGDAASSQLPSSVAAWVSLPGSRCP